MKKILKALCPPVLWQWLRRSRELRFYGDFPDWAAAAAASGTTYASPVIIERASRAANEVVSGRAVFERDTVCFSEAEYNFQFLAALATARPELVLDIGGGLGSMFFQHGKFLSHIDYRVVEQPGFVEAGNALNISGLRFFETVADALADGAVPDLAVFASVLGYLEDPGRVLTETVERGAYAIFIDRTLFAPVARIAVEKTPASLGGISYPVRILVEEPLFAAFDRKYERVFDFTALEGRVRLHAPGGEAVSRGFLWKKVR